MAKSGQTASYEPAGVARPGLVAGGVIGMLAFAAIAMGVLYLFYRPAAPEGPVAVTPFDEPRLQTDPSADLAALESRQHARLNRTIWLDDSKSTLSIPIEAAMKAVAARGTQAFAPIPGTGPDQGEPDRPAAAVAPPDRRANPGAGVPPMMEAPQ